MPIEIRIPAVPGKLLRVMMVVGVAVPATGAPQFHLVELEGELQCDGYAISSNGIVAGISIYETTFGEWQAVLWDIDGMPTFLGNEPDGFNTDGYGINRDGDVVGWDQQKPLLWRDGETTVLDALSGQGRGGVAYDITDSRVIVGMSLSHDSSTFVATMWDNTEPVSLGTLPGDRRSEAFGISEAGIIVGHSGNLGAGDYEAFLWDGGIMVGLGTLGGPESNAVDVNNLGTVVGWSETPNDVYFHAMKWTDGVMVSLFEPEGTLRSSASSVNDYEEMVGHCDPDVSAGFAALWVGDRLYDLNELVVDPRGLYLYSANDINNRGQITGWLSGDADSAFRLDPVFSLFDPEPGVAAENNALRIFGSEEGNRIVFIYGFQEGSVSVPGCQGLTVDIRNPRLAGTAVANEDGRAQITGIVPGAARGRTTRLQAVDLDACTVTPVFDWTWE